MTVNEFLPFFSIRHGPHGDDDGCFWYAQRKPSLRRDDDGSEMSITLVDRDMNPRVPSVDTLSIGLTCTNRDLPAALPYGGDRSEEHTSELQSLMRLSYAVFCLKKKNTIKPKTN